jgi:AraC-like DNA-binding protein/mannose-6-phosphate isomerase-like protein (cupin superfamily)
MARNVRASTLDRIKRPVVAVGNDYPAGYLHGAHCHRRNQLLFAESGTMQVETQHGSWMVPPHQAMWIPAGIRHSISMLSDVATRSVYLDDRSARRTADQCQVVGVSPLLRELLIQAVDLPAEYAPRTRDGRIMALLIDEIRLAPTLPLSLPFPKEQRLAARCRRFIAHPTAQDTIETWSRSLGMSRRTFTRLFRQETGLSFSAWQRRACLLSTVPRLLAGEPVTTIAFDLDYSSPAAFTAMFRNLVGASPTAYRRAAH